MEQCKRTIAAVVLALVIALAMAIPVSQPASAALSPDGWATQTSGTTSTLYGVWGDSSSSIFACGEFGTILHYDGTSWTPMSTGVNNVFFGIWGSSSDNVFAVGQNGIIIHYDGDTWTQVYSLPGTHLNGIWGTSSTDIFVVGNVGAILHYDGSSWSAMPNSNNSHLQSVWGTASDDIFAAGNGGTVLHYNGSDWTSMVAGNPPNFSGIWGSAPDDVFVVGNNGSIMHYDGTSWTPMTSGVGNDLYAVWGTAGNDVFVVGQSGRILHYDGVSWAPMDSGITRDLWGIWGNDPLNVYAVGQSGNILHYKEPAPVVISVNPTYGNQGETMSVIIDGGNFGTTTSVDFGADISVDNFTINNQTRITVDITIDSNAISGPRDVTITNLYGEGALYDGFTVPYATVTGVSPNSGDQGETLEVTISGTNMGAATGLSFGFGISVDPPTIHTPTQITTEIHIHSDAISGPRSVSVITPGYTAVLTDGFTVNGPTVTAVVPATADQGQTLEVTISGTNLAHTTEVDFGDGITTTEFEVDGPTQVTATISIDPAATPGNRDVVVTTTEGSATLPAGFAVATADPVITGIDPDYGIQGETLDVTITGSHLIDPSAVSFGDGIAINDYSSDNATWIVVSITIDPAATLGARDVVVTTAGGIATLTDGFTVLIPEPNISEVSPAEGIQGQTLDVTITGTYLIDPSAISFGDGIAINDYSSDNATWIVVSITIDPAAAPGARDIVVTTAGGIATLTDGFTVLIPEPNISEVSPAEGIQGQTLDVTITGTYLTDGTVAFGDGITVNSYGTGSATQIVVSITIDPAAAPGARDVVVTTAGGVATPEDGFTVVAAEPTISAVAPASGTQDQTLEVVITGTYLTDASAVSFGNGITVTDFTVDSATRITASITIGATAVPGTRSVSVVTPAGTANMAGGFTINALPPLPPPAPTLAAASPASGNQGQTLNITITGNNLTGTSAVSFGDGIEVNSFTVNSATQVTVSVTIGEAASPGARDITVTTPGGSYTLDNAFTVTVPPPTLESIDHTWGRQGETLTVVITGTRLDGATEVGFGQGIIANSFTVDSSTQITASITIDKDAGDGPRDVSVVTPGGNDSLPAGFDVEEAGGGCSWWMWLLVALAVLLIGLLVLGIWWRKKRAEEE